MQPIDPTQDNWVWLLGSIQAEEAYKSDKWDAWAETSHPYVGPKHRQRRISVRHFFTSTSSELYTKEITEAFPRSKAMFPNP